MSIPSVDLVLQQGEDKEINLVRMAGDPPAPVDLTGYSLRMDVRSEAGVLLYTINTDDLDPDTDDEASLDSEGNIFILIPHSVSLDGGALFAQVGKILFFDVMLRNPSLRQQKILRGTILIEASQTQWL